MKVIEELHKRVWKETKLQLAQQEKQLESMLLKWQETWGIPCAVFDKNNKLIGLGPPTKIGEIQSIWVRTSHEQF